MRILIDEKDLEWEEAWAVTRATIAYTNHTLAPEALEKWPAALLEEVVPRHLQIILEINRRLLDRVSLAWPGDLGRRKRMSIIEEPEPRHVRMAHLAMAGSHAINGVSTVHTEAVQSSLAPDYFELWPERFHNVTNGISQRRWLLGANPGLAALITAAIGDAWITDLPKLKGLERHAEDAGFRLNSGRSSAPTRRRWPESSGNSISTWIQSRCSTFT
jgi:starch phosphorylase